MSNVIPFSKKQTKYDGDTDEIPIAKPSQDTMLLDEFFPSRQEREFNRRVGVLIPQLKQWGLKADLNFLYRVYKLRSEIVHNGDRHLLNHFDLHTLEAVVVVVLNMLTDSGASTHAEALKSLNIKAPSKKAPFSLKSWVRSILSGRKPDQLK